MKNLINAVTAEQKKHLDSFIKEINESHTDFKSLDHWAYTELLPKGKKLGLMELTMSLTEVKAYLVKRMEAKIYKNIEKEVNEIKEVFNAGDLISAKITVEWKKNRTWGANPTAEAWAQFKNKEGHIDSTHTSSGSIGGCGYDKKSTAVANALNQINAILKPLYKAKNKDIEKPNRELLGYGSGYGILPHLEGGVGVECYPRIFEKVGYKFESVASGNNFDVFIITKIK